MGFCFQGFFGGGWMGLIVVVWGVVDWFFVWLGFFYYLPS